VRASSELRSRFSTTNTGINFFFLPLTFCMISTSVRTLYRKYSSIFGIKEK
jgi:hypothetical protein